MSPEFSFLTRFLDQLIFNLNIKRWVVYFTFRLLYTQGRRPIIYWIGSWVAPRAAGTKSEYLSTWRTVPEALNLQQLRYENPQSCVHLLCFSLEQSTWEADIHSSDEGILSLSWNAESHYRFYEIRPLVPVLSQMHPIQALTPCFYKTRFNRIKLSSYYLCRKLLTFKTACCHLYLCVLMIVKVKGNYFCMVILFYRSFYIDVFLSMWVTRTNGTECIV